MGDDKVFSSKMTLGQLDFFINMIKDLVRINDTIICRVDNDNVLMFSYVGKTLNDIQAFKNYIIPTTDLMTHKRELETPFIFVIKEAKKFLRNISNYKDYDSDVTFKFLIEPSNDYVNFLNCSNVSKKLNMRIYGGDPVSLSKDITIDDINFLMDIEKSDFSIGLNSDDFSKIKKMSAIDSNNEILNLTIDENKVFLGESTKWSLEIADLEYKNIDISFPKKYFTALDIDNETKLYVFESFILIKSTNSNLMILRETRI